jgi:hypothetical protein
MNRSPLLIGAHDQRRRLLQMGVARISVGVSIGVAPRLGARVFGAPAEQVTPVAALLARLVAVRNVTLGMWALALRDAGAAERRRFVRYNLAVDVVDLAVITPLLLRRDLRRTAVMAGALATSAIFGWLDLLAGD